MVQTHAQFGTFGHTPGWPPVSWPSPIIPSALREKGLLEGNQQRRILAMSPPDEPAGQPPLLAYGC